MNDRRYPRLWVLLAALGAATAGASVLSLSLGAQPLPARQVVRVLFHGLVGRPLASRPAPATDHAPEGAEAAEPPIPDDRAANIIFRQRLPRMALALLVGAALAVSGMVMQGFFQNPMADPYLLGVSSGASLGATVGLLMLPVTVDFGATAALLAFAGAIGVTVLVYALSRGGGRTPVTTLLLTGIAIGSLASAVSAYLFIRRPNGIQTVFVWLMGSFQGANGPRVEVMAAATVVGLAVTAAFTRDLNVMLMGDETAAHLGVEVERVRQVLLVVAALLAATAVSVVGIIGFVGLVVPNLMRLVTGPKHERLLPACVLAGGALTVLADVVARLVYVAEIPVGIVTAFIGCPFFLFLLRRSKRSSA